MGIALDGLVSGLNTTELINALMDVQAIPRNLMSAKADDKKLIISQLQTLNTSLQDLAAKAKTAASGESLNTFSATSSSNNVTVALRPGAAALTADIVVDRLAQKHTVVTAASAEWPDAPPTLTLENAAGERLEITASSSSMTDVARAINSAGFGISASVVAAGTDVDGNPVQRLQLISAESGADSAFRVFRGDEAAVAAGTAADVATAPGAAVVTTGSDAQVRLWAGTAAEQVITSSKNTFTDLFAGVDVTVTAASADPVTVGVAVDDKARTTAAADFVKQIASLLTRIDNGSKATVGTGDDATTLGVFTGDSTVRALRQSLAQAVQHPIDGVSPSSIGISIDRYGVLTIDETKFAAALADDPDAVTAMFTGVAERVQQTAETYSDKYDGLLTARITGQQSEVDSLGRQLESWDVRLEQRRATLERTYARLETMLSQMQSQSAYLTSQLSSLPSYDTGSN
ncbi:flagellar filament capping protein FliD [Microbacterium aerolatum]|uniref:Flagellar hook-associated protein 2 n=1 Tax=Microbacterium aerolatum TaxID=153731 RepID=A0A511AM34_9MICO|nr:flagellar filament capping protein FliD [Microbacterium aerolatum]GEK86927.1 lateral flagellar hook-associated protein 2 [Microbacterium aerolatum]GGB15848.1 lateral flagellar hook-associated protein 2 [Microbacterium aerolatum]